MPFPSSDDETGPQHRGTGGETVGGQSRCSSEPDLTVWRDAGFDYDCALLWSQGGFAPEAATPWDQFLRCMHGGDPEDAVVFNDWVGTAAAWASQGLTLDDFVAFAATALDPGDVRVWLDAGYLPDEVETWVDTGLIESPGDVEAWQAAGWDHEQVRWLHYELPFAGPETASHWRGLGLSAERTIRCAEVGFDLDEVLTLMDDGGLDSTLFLFMEMGTR